MKDATFFEQKKWPQFDDSQDRAGWFARLIQEINWKIGSGENYENLLDFIFESLEQVIPYDRIGVGLVDDKMNNIRLIWAKSKIAPRYLDKGYVTTISGSSLEQIVQSGESRIIDDLLEYQAGHPSSESTNKIIQDGIRSSLTCPLRARGKTIGVVFFSSYQTSTYSMEHVQSFLAIAGEISVIIEHARLQNYFDDSEAKEKSVSRILHDLKSPLSVIKGYLELLKEDCDQSLPNEVRNVCRILERNAGGMVSMIDEIGQLRTETSSELQQVDIQEFVFEEIQSAYGLVKTKDISLNSFVDPNLPKYAKFDSVKIHRVLSNLLTNAVKFSMRGTQIKLSIRANRGQFIFEVTDQGQGIKPEEMDKLFTEFGRTSTRPTEGESSTGLGLVIAKNFVQQHGGEIWAKSDFGLGSTFCFWIPLLGALPNSKPE